MILLMERTKEGFLAGREGWPDIGGNGGNIDDSGSKTCFPIKDD